MKRTRTRRRSVSRSQCSNEMSEGREDSEDRSLPPTPPPEDEEEEEVRRSRLARMAESTTDPEQIGEKSADGDEQAEGMGGGKVGEGGGVGINYQLNK